LGETGVALTYVLRSGITGNEWDELMTRARNRGNETSVTFRT